MADVNTILNQRIKKNESSSKMAAMAKQSATGNLTSFAGVFSVVELNEKEKYSLEQLLKEYVLENEDITLDLDQLISITAEVKAINNQAAILHGERIKQAHRILTRYRDGAFTAWLLAAYGNRQTPYNLMQYYEFYETLPRNLRPQLEAMPRQAIYTLATRTGSFEKKQEIIANYQGESKTEVLTLIRQVFPINEQDQRHQRRNVALVKQLQRLKEEVKRSYPSFTNSQKKEINAVLKELQEWVN